MSKRSGTEELAQDIIDAITDKVVSGGVLSFAIADRIKDNHKLMAEIVKNIDPDLLGRELAKQILYVASYKKGTNVEAVKVYESVMKIAQSKASTILAQEIAEGVKHA